MKIIKSFYSEHIATIYEARLLEAGIPCFISNKATSGLVPFGDGGLNLHVQEDLFEKANEIIAELDQNMNTKVEEDYSDADLGDIEYEQAINEFERKEKENPWKNKSFIFLFIFMLAILILSFILNLNPS